MGKAMEILTGAVVGTTAAVTALTMASGDSLTIRDFSTGNCSLLSMFATGNTDAITMTLRSARMHDNVRGITIPIPATLNVPQLWLPALQKFLPQDTLIAEMAIVTTASDVVPASLIVYYDDLPGVAARLITVEELLAQSTNLISIQNTLALTIGPNYTGAQVINTTNDLFKANTDYALLGLSSTVKSHAITLRGSDTGNLRIGCPGNMNGVYDTRDYFVALSKLTGKACIPVINSANKSNTFFEGVQDEGAADPVVTSYWAELGAVSA